MDQATFVATEWLKQDQTTTGIDQSRTEIGNYFGWSDGWYADDLSLGQLYDFLQRRAPRLLEELDEASDEDRRQAWIAGVADASRYDPPERDANYGMFYRYDKLTQVYDWAESETFENWMTQEDADLLVRSRPENSEPPKSSEISEPSRPDNSGYSEAAWDSSWKMLYRVGPDGVYQYAYSDDQIAVRPGTGWLSYEELPDAEPVAPQPTAEPALDAEAVTTESPAEEAQRQAEEVMAELTPENLSSLASELEVDEALLSGLIDKLPDNFQSMVEAEAMALADE